MVPHLSDVPAGPPRHTERWRVSAPMLVHLPSAGEASAYVVADEHGAHPGCLKRGRLSRSLFAESASLSRHNRHTNVDYWVTIFYAWLLYRCELDGRQQGDDDDDEVYRERDDIRFARPAPSGRRALRRHEQDLEHGRGGIRQAPHDRRAHREPDGEREGPRIRARLGRSRHRGGGVVGHASEYRAYETLTDWSGPARATESEAAADVEERNRVIRSRGGIASAVIA